MFLGSVCFAQSTGAVGGRHGGMMQADGPQDQGNPQGKMAISDEAVSACDDASEKDDCSFEATIGSSSKMMSGTCMKNPKDESKLFCAPAVKNNTDADSVEEVEAMRDDRESEISKIENRVEKIISFLKSEDIDTDEIESDLETFKDKADALLSAIDAYIDALGDNSDDDAVKSDRESVGSAGKAMMDYFHETLRKSIEEALLKVN